LRAAHRRRRGPRYRSRPATARIGVGRRSGGDARRPGRMILIDTSAWVEFLRDTGSPVCLRVDELLGEEIATCHPVRMEVLAGARDEQHLEGFRGVLARAS